MVIELYELVGRDDRRFSPYCWRVKLSLAHKKLEYRTVPVGFTEKYKIEFSGQNLVPVLDDNGTIVHDSWEIAEYLRLNIQMLPNYFREPREGSWQI